jgi:hypothetical protein
MLTVYIGGEAGKAYKESLRETPSYCALNSWVAWCLEDTINVWQDCQKVVSSKLVGMIYKGYLVGATNKQMLRIFLNHRYNLHIVNDSSLSPNPCILCLGKCISRSKT